MTSLDKSQPRSLTIGWQQPFTAFKSSAVSTPLQSPARLLDRPWSRGSAHDGPHGIRRAHRGHRKECPPARAPQRVRPPAPVDSAPFRVLNTVCRRDRLLELTLPPPLPAPIVTSHPPTGVPSLGERARARLRRARESRPIRSRQDGASPASLDQPLRASRASTREEDLGRSGGGGRVTTANAVAGAVAGTLVSIVLHPVDTLKVTIQADRAARQPLARVLARMLRERGVFGLYSGLSASLASSAPISAIYTASYEAVKSRLMPMFPEECAWVAHCMAGGCASVATSFVYTPSECVKQRCQVSGAMTAWQATRGIVAEGGVFGLYKGWTAVLCRNIPQSAIKFFVFEQLMRTVHLCAGAGGAAASPVPTFAVGGIAGSTAAMFTTPFDTIKTRLQTRGVTGADGGAAAGVLPTMRDIVAKEGVGGLYRGVTPRLFIYITQGAVFFTAYEITRMALLGYVSRDEDDGSEDAGTKARRR